MATKETEEKVTKVFLDEYKGNDMFGVWEVDNKGEKVGKFPLVSFGKTKANHILNHITELKDFAGVE